MMQEPSTTTFLSCLSCKTEQEFAPPERHHAEERSAWRGSRFGSAVALAGVSSAPAAASRFAGVYPCWDSARPSRGGEEGAGAEQNPSPVPAPHSSFLH